MVGVTGSIPVAPTIAKSAAHVTRGAILSLSLPALVECRHSDSFQPILILARGSRQRAMRFLIFGLALLSLVLSSSARAAIWELPLGPYGTLRLDMPDGWTAKLQGRETQNAGT